jgi:hypothetical protein
MGAANLGLAVGKGFALGGAVAGLGATGVGAPAAAVLAVYGTVSIFGQGLTGTVMRRHDTYSPRFWFVVSLRS